MKKLLLVFMLIFMLTACDALEETEPEVETVFITEYVVYDECDMNLIYTDLIEFMAQAYNDELIDYTVEIEDGVIYYYSDGNLVDEDDYQLFLNTYCVAEVAE